MILYICPHRRSAITAWPIRWRIVSWATGCGTRCGYSTHKRTISIPSVASASVGSRYEPTLIAPAATRRM
eukprot:2534386-Pleurochrysis_carterae.AAC.4